MVRKGVVSIARRERKLCIGAVGREGARSGVVQG